MQGMLSSSAIISFGELEYFAFLVDLLKLRDSNSFREKKKIIKRISGYRYLLNEQLKEIINQNFSRLYQRWYIYFRYKD